jgi:WD40 repeat protein
MLSHTTPASMTMDSIQMGYQLIGQKMWRVKWLPDLQDTEHLYCVTGSYGDRVPMNTISIWSCTAPTLEHRSQWKRTATRKADYFPTLDYRIDVIMETSEQYLGDVCDIAVVGGRNIITASSLGFINFFEVQSDRQGSWRLLKRTSFSQSLHGHAGNQNTSPIVAIEWLADSHQVVSISEDGSLTVLQLRDAQLSTIFRIHQADTITPTCLVHITTDQCLSGNAAGGLKLWDLRNKSSNRPSISFHESNHVGVNAIAHPKPGHSLRITTARRDGGISLWDLRNISAPIAYTVPHVHAKNDIWHIMYHGSDQIITSGEDSRICVLSESIVYDTLGGLSSTSSALLRTYGHDSHPLSINHFDIYPDIPLLVACTDTEALLFHPMVSTEAMQ